MKIRITISFAVLVVVALGVFGASITNTTSAQSSRAAQLWLKGTTTLAEAPPAEAMGATCFCKVTANGTEVAKPSKGGYVQGFQKEACKNYCRGQWDANQAQRIAWAQILPISNTCDVNVAMYAAIGTASYDLVRGPENEHLGNLVTKSECPTGQPFSNTIGGNKYCLIPPLIVHVQGQQDGVVPGGYVWNNGDLFKTSGLPKSVKLCQ